MFVYLLQFYFFKVFLRNAYNSNWSYTIVYWDSLYTLYTAKRFIKSVNILHLLIVIEKRSDHHTLVLSSDYFGSHLDSVHHICDMLESFCCNVYKSCCICFHIIRHCNLQNICNLSISWIRYNLEVLLRSHIDMYIKLFSYNCGLFSREISQIIMYE